MSASKQCQTRCGPASLLTVDRHCLGFSLDLQCSDSWVKPLPGWQVPCGSSLFLLLAGNSWGNSYFLGVYCFNSLSFGETQQCL